MPPGAGYAGVPAVSAGATLLPTLHAGWLLASLSILAAHVTVTMGAAEEVHLTAFGGDF